MVAGNRKVDDLDVIRLNSLGLSLMTIAKQLNVHHTTVTHRLKTLNIQPADTRRSFMEDVVSQLTPRQQDWLVDQLGPNRSIKNYVRDLIVKEFVTQTGSKNPSSHFIQKTASL